MREQVLKGILFIRFHRFLAAWHDPFGRFNAHLQRPIRTALLFNIAKECPIPFLRTGMSNMPFPIRCGRSIIQGKMSNIFCKTFNKRLGCPIFPVKRPTLVFTFPAVDPTFRPECSKSFIIPWDCPTFSTICSSFSHLCSIWKKICPTWKKK